jgi:hypothetical protein
VGKANDERRGRCRLCLEEKELRKSHVLSEFLYEQTYERSDPEQPKQGRMLKVPADTDEKPRQLQKGLRERLLCGRCEQHLNRIGEQYASRVIKRIDETEVSTGEQYTIVTGVEYRPFKLFLMTQLWRAGVASDAFWKEVRLGPHEERLREMLLQANPGKPHEYACEIFRNRDPGDLAGDLASRAVVQPMVGRSTGHTYYGFIARGYAWRYIVSSHSKEAWNPRSSLSERGELPIIFDATGSIE